MKINGRHVLGTRSCTTPKRIDAAGPTKGKGPLVTSGRLRRAKAVCNERGVETAGIQSRSAHHYPCGKHELPKVWTIGFDPKHCFDCAVENIFRSLLVAVRP